MKPLLICITGADGSGKSTACARVRALLAQRLGETSVREVSVWDSLAPPGSPFRTKSEAETYLADLDGSSRTLFIYHALARALQLGSRAGARVLLLNGYWFKYAVSEIGYGVPETFVLGAAQTFALPDEVICLDVSPEVAWQRRQGATAYEQGPVISADSQAQERFVRFQGKLGVIWQSIEAGSGLKWRHLSSLRPPEDLATEISAGVLQRLQEKKP